MVHNFAKHEKYYIFVPSIFAVTCKVTEKISGYFVKSVTFFLYKMKKCKLLPYVERCQLENGE